MLGDLLFEGLAVVGEWILDAVFGDDEDEAEDGKKDDADSTETVAGDTDGRGEPNR